jgi:scyllo-inositol 2-dehydrogenase (NADP+)
VEEADRLIALAEARGLRLAVNHQYRFMDLYRVAAERVRSGEHAPLYLVEAWQHVHQSAAARGWRGRLARSTLFEFGGHVLDLILWFFGASPEAVSCQMPRAPAGATAEALVHLALSFPGERLATVTLHRASHAPPRYLEMRLSCPGAALRLSLGGVARADLEWSRTLGRPAAAFSLGAGGLGREERRGRSRVLVREGRDPYRRATARLLAALVADIEDGAAGPVAAREARDVLRVLEAAYESARTGLTVSLARAAV